MAKKRKSKAWIWILLLIIIAAAATWFFVFRKKGPEAIEVTTAKVGKRTITQTVSAIGKIQPETEIKVSSETSGEVIYVGVEEGDTVKKGQLLVRINPDIIETQLEQQRTSAEATKRDIEARKAEVKRSEADLQRIKELYEKEFVSKQELDQATAAYESAVAALEASEQRYQTAIAALSQVERNALRTTIYAPMNGVVTMLDVEEGEKVVGTEMMEGTEMMRISDLSVMNAVVEVDENDIILVSIGDTTNIEIDAIPNRLYSGVVVEIGHSAIQSNLGSQDQVTNFEVKVRLLENDTRFRPGMSCNVDIITEVASDVIAIPLQAVTVRADKSFDTTPDVNESSGPRKNENRNVRTIERPPSLVFLNENGKAKIKNVETGISDKGFIEVKEGLSEGDEIVSGSFTAVSSLLFDGAVLNIDTTKKKQNFRRN